MIECTFVWGKQDGTLRKTKYPGIRRVAADFLLNLIAYNLVRFPKLVPAWGGLCPQPRWNEQRDLEVTAGPATIALPPSPAATFWWMT